MSLQSCTYKYQYLELIYEEKEEGGEKKSEEDEEGGSGEVEEEEGRMRIDMIKIYCVSV